MNKMSETVEEPRYYKPALSRTLLHRIKRLFEEFPAVNESYDNNSVKFIERAVLNLIDEEEQKQMARVEFLRNQRE